MRLHNKSIIITGASSGIGAAAARLFASEGARLVLGARRKGLLKTLSDEIIADGRRAEIVVGDVCDDSFQRNMVETAERVYGGLDAAFNNAGMTGELSPIEDMPRDTWDTVITTNLTSAYLAATHQIPAMKRQGAGSMVFTGSFVGVTIGLPGMAAYAASKAGLTGLIQVLAAELGKDAIRVNALLPGGTQTEMAGNDPETLQAIARMHALGRMAAPDEIAKAALFLISDDASFVTGSQMFADGGNSVFKP